MERGRKKDEGEKTVRNVRRVSNHTKVNFRIVVDGHVDLFLGLGRPAVVLGRMVVGEGLDSLLDELVALLFELLSVAVLARVDTATVVVILGRGRGGAVTIRRHDIVDLELLRDLLDAQVQRVRLELLAGHVGQDGRGEAHEAGRLVVRRVAPPVALLAAKSASIEATIRRGRSTGLWTAAALQIAIPVVATAVAVAPFTAIAAVAPIVAAVTTVAASVAAVVVAAAVAAGLSIATKATHFPERDVVRAGDSLVSPRHRGAGVDKYRL